MLHWEGTKRPGEVKTLYTHRVSHYTARKIYTHSITALHNANQGRTINTTILVLVLQSLASNRCHSDTDLTLILIILSEEPESNPDLPSAFFLAHQWPLLTDPSNGTNAVTARKRSRQPPRVRLKAGGARRVRPRLVRSKRTRQIHGPRTALLHLRQKVRKVKAEDCLQESARVPTTSMITASNSVPVREAEKTHGGSSTIAGGSFAASSFGYASTKHLHLQLSDAPRNNAS